MRDDVFNIAKGMVKINQGITGEQCVRNDDGVLAVSDEDHSLEKLWWEAFEHTVCIR